MTKKSTANAKKPMQKKKLALKKETLSDLSPKEGTADLVRAGLTSIRFPTHG